MISRTRKRMVNKVRSRVAAPLAAIVVTLTTASISLAQRNFRVLVNFDGANGFIPQAGVVQGPDGSLYGTTVIGGMGNERDCAGDGCGTIFKMTPGGTLTTLYSFCVQTGCPDGSEPSSDLVLATDGNFYGTARFGGLNTLCPMGCGTIFKITPEGELTVLYSFGTLPNDGSDPEPSLVQGIDGELYGVTDSGGTIGAGTVFKITLAGTLTTLYQFCAQENCPDGAYPTGLVQAVDGNIYGTTAEGGANLFRGGTVFKVTPAGTLTTLYSFCSQTDCSDGSEPTGLVQAADGTLYGTTYYGARTMCGGGLGCGTAFRITATGSLITLHIFDGTDGANPSSPPLQATDGNLYGTTSDGGKGYGTVYRITSMGVLSTLHRFDVTDGEYPYAGLVQATNGRFYGTTLYGGTIGDGTVFSLSVGLGPFVETLPTEGKVSTPVRILGNNLAGATSVTFNGISTTFKVASPSEIDTDVPFGATTGKVQVVTPGGTLTSNVAFQVIPTAR